MTSKVICVRDVPIRRFLEKTLGYTVFEADYIATAMPKLCQAITQAACSLADKEPVQAFAGLGTSCKDHHMSKSETKQLFVKMEQAVERGVWI